MEVQPVKWPAWPPKSLKPTLSFSSLNAYAMCQLGWFFQYLTGEIPTRSLRQQVYLEKGLDSAAGVPGTVVHETIEEAARVRRDTGVWPDDLPAIAQAILARHREDSLSWLEDYRLSGRTPAWDDPRKAIDVDYYGTPWTDADLARIDADMRKCLGNWVEAGFPQFLDRFPTEHWRVPAWLAGTTPWFWLTDEIPVYAKLDFAVTSPETLYIFDWKTGNEDYDNGKVDQQLRFYAAFAQLYWRRPPEQVQVAAVWLSSGTEWDLHQVTTEELEAARMDWTRRHADLKAQSDACRNDPKGFATHFPPTGAPKACQYCAFHACPAREEPVAAAVGRGNVDDPFAQPDRSDPFADQ